jgi:hypothetical protein
MDLFPDSSHFSSVIHNFLSILTVMVTHDLSLVPFSYFGYFMSEILWMLFLLIFLTLAFPHYPTYFSEFDIISFKFYLQSWH